MVDTPDLLKSKKREESHGRVRSTAWSQTKKLDGSWEFQPRVETSVPVTTLQVTATEGHPWTGHYSYQDGDVGGPFETTRRYMSDSKFGPKRLKTDSIPMFGAYTQPAAGLIYHTHGHLMPSNRFTNKILSAWPQPSPSDNLTLMALGTKAISIVKPTNSIADLSVSLAETLREGVPAMPGTKLWEDRARIARGAGSEYLNVQFGWLPLVGEIDNLAKVASQGGEIWKQYERDAGKNVRRRMQFDPIYEPPEIVYSSETGNFPYPTPNTYFFTPGFGGGTYTITRWVRRERWFSGAFTYHLPDRHSDSKVEQLLAASAKARKLYGLTLDPEVLWNLTPWSWAIDWFANTGDVISNLTDAATDGLVLRYGYMMEKTTVSHEHTLRGLSWRCTPKGPGSRTLYAVTETKKRIRATPYGFGLTWESFTPRQIAILAALGITRR